MKRVKNLWPQIISWSNLLQAYKRARRGKQDRAEVARFSFNLEYELRALQTALQEGDYRPGEYRQYTIYERKPRLISVAPFRDRVVHHALMGVIDPHLDNRLIEHTYACRQNKGVHAAVDYLQQQMGRYPYLLKLDIASYFASIDHQRLKEKLRRVLADKDVLHLLGSIIDSAPISTSPTPVFPGDDLIDLMRPKGVPIGNLTSQFFGNWFLNRFDHFLKDELALPAYVRYVDDLVILADSKTQLHELSSVIQQQLQSERLQIHTKKHWIQPSHSGVEFLGYRIWPNKRRLRADNGYQFRRRLTKMTQDYRAGRLDLPEIKGCIASWLGHARFGQTRGLRQSLFAQHVFTRGNAPNESGCSRRVMEQQPAEPAFCQPQQEQRQ